jgi:hypothetical protein
LSALNNAVAGGMGAEGVVGFQGEVGAATAGSDSASSLSAAGSS